LGEATGVGSIRITNGASALTSAGGLEFKIAGDINGFGSKIQALNSAGSQLVFANRFASATWVERMRITSDGSVGIGTSSPAAKLDVSGVTRSSGTFNPTNTDWVNAAFRAQGAFGGAISLIDGSAGYGIWAQDSGATFVIGQGSTSGALTERMRITSAGKVGVNTNTPYGTFEVLDGGQTPGANPTTFPTIQITQGSAGINSNGGLDFRGSSFGSGYGFRISAVDASGVHLVFGNRQNSSTYTEAMRLDSSGNLLVGTTSSVGKVTVESTSNVIPALFLNNSGSSGTANPSISIRKFDNNTTTSNVFAQFTVNNGSAGSGQINADGANAAAFGSFSDARLKENIVGLPSQLANILALRPVEFDYIESEGGGHQIGFIAQEMQEVYSDAVGERSDGMLTVTGWNKTEARLVAAIQEQQALIQDLTTRLTTLEGN
jgi:hypothetical protein